MSATRPGSLTLPDIIAGAFELLVRHAARFYAPALILAALAALDLTAVGRLPDLFGVRTYLEAKSNTTADVSLFSLYGFFFCVLLALALLNFVSDALLVPLALDAIAGRTPRLRSGLAAFWAALPAAIVIWLVISVSLGLLMISVVGIPVALYLFVRWGFAVQVVCDERARALAALRRSSQIVQGRWWRTALVLTVFLVLLLAAQLVVDRVFGVGTGAAGIAITVAFFWLVTPFSVLGRTVLYADTKARKGEHLQPPQALAG